MSFDPQNRLVTSPLFSPTILACIRLSVALYTLVAIIFFLIWDGVVSNEAGQFFSYFTDLTYIGICSYFWAAGVQTFVFLWEGEKGYPLKRWKRFLQVLHMVLQASIMTFPILVTIVFWGLLASKDTFATPMSRWRNISVHALNSVFCLFEVLCTNNPSPQWIMLPLMLLILGGYLAIAYITHATQGFYPYAFLDLKKQGPGKLAAYIVGITAAEVIIFVLIWGVMKLKTRVLPVPNLDGSLVDETRELKDTGSDEVSLKSGKHGYAV